MDAVGQVQEAHQCVDKHSMTYSLYQVLLEAWRTESTQSHPEPHRSMRCHYDTYRGVVCGGGSTTIHELTLFTYIGAQA